MSTKLNDDRESLVPQEGFIEDVKQDGSKTFQCKQCNKESKCEKGIKMHITSMHKKQLKRTCSQDDSKVIDDGKKARFGLFMDEKDTADDFEFDPLDIETSSQVGGDEHLDKTSDICGEFLWNKPEHESKLYDGLDNTVEQILLARGNPNPLDADLINLDETMTSDQDHNYLKDDQNENELNVDKAEVLSLQADLREKENQILSLVEENSRLKEEMKIKDEVNDALTAKNNSLDDAFSTTKTKVETLEATKTKYEKRLKTYGTTIKEMDIELKQVKGSMNNATDTEQKRQFEVLSEKLNKENKDLNEKLQKTTKVLNEKQKELKQVQSVVKRKEISEKELQKSLNEKNGKISELEATNTRLEMICEHGKEINDKNQAAKKTAFNANEKVKTVDAEGPLEKEPSKKATTKCFYENNGDCRDQERCKFLHPKKTCQSFSKLGSCSQESLCEHRHPQKVCFRLQSTGYCPSGDRCRKRHPLEYAYQDLSQGSSPRTPQDVGVHGGLTGQEQWTPPPLAGAGRGGRHPQQGYGAHQPQQQGQGVQYPHQGQGGQMW